MRRSEAKQVRRNLGQWIPARFTRASFLTTPMRASNESLGQQHRFRPRTRSEERRAKSQAQRAKSEGLSAKSEEQRAKRTGHQQVRRKSYPGQGGEELSLQSSQRFS